MRGSTHLAAGAFAAIALSEVLPCPDSSKPLMQLAIGLGSLLPDIDSVSSKLGRRIAPVSILFQLILGHRQLLHSLTFWTLATVALIYFFPAHSVYIGCILIGCILHLFLDMLNPSGVPLLMPIKFRFHIANIPCGGIVDHFLRLIFSILAGYAFYAHYFQFR